MNKQEKNIEHLQTKQIPNRPHSKQVLHSHIGNSIRRAQPRPGPNCRHLSLFLVPSIHRRAPHLMSLFPQTSSLFDMSEDRRDADGFHTRMCNCFFDFQSEGGDDVIETYGLLGPLAVPVAAGVVVDEKARENGEGVANLGPAGVGELEVEICGNGEEGVEEGSGGIETGTEDVNLGEGIVAQDGVGEVSF